MKLCRKISPCTTRVGTERRVAVTVKNKMVNVNHECKIGNIEPRRKRSGT